MAFEIRDKQALAAAKAAGIRNRGAEYFDSSHVLQTLVCPQHVTADDPHLILRKAIEACDRWTSNTTVCVEVESGANVPSYVNDAIDLLAADCYPAKVIVVLDDASTHLPGNLLPQPLRDAVSKIHSGGTIWHPIAKRAV